MAKLKIKNNSVKEANEPAAFGKAYQDFVGRCWSDTPDGKKKPNYSEKAINFLLDCAHIANGTSVKGLPQQGFKLTKAGNADIVGDCLHLCYNEVDGNKAVDIWLNPHTQKALVDLDGFNPEDPYSSTHKEFSARDYTSDDFYEFIKNLPTYKGEAKTAESRKMTIRVHESDRDTFTDEQKDLFANALKQQGIRQPLITIEDTQIIFKHKGVLVGFICFGDDRVGIEIKPYQAFTKVIKPVMVSCKYSDTAALMEEAIPSIVASVVAIATSMGGMILGLDDLEIEQKMF